MKNMKTEINHKKKERKFQNEIKINAHKETPRGKKAAQSTGTIRCFLHKSEMIEINEIIEVIRLFLLLLLLLHIRVQLRSGGWHQEIQEDHHWRHRGNTSWYICCWITSREPFNKSLNKWSIFLFGWRTSSSSSSSSSSPNHVRNVLSLRFFSSGKNLTNLLASTIRQSDSIVEASFYRVPHIYTLIIYIYIFFQNICIYKACRNELFTQSVGPVVK